jgi:DNA-binding transcriptional LysR family regulator
MSHAIEYAMKAPNTATIKHMAMAGLGLAILPETAVGAEIRDGRLVRLSLPSLYMVQEVTLYHKENRALTPAKQEFVKLLQRKLRRERVLKR